MEKQYIAKYLSSDSKFGYNISKGGKNPYEGLHHTDEYKAKMSSINKVKVYSADTIKRMRSCHAKERKPVCRRSPNGAVKEYESLGCAAGDVFGHKSNISRACLSGKPYKGFYWEFKKTEEVVCG